MQLNACRGITLDLPLKFRAGPGATPPHSGVADRDSTRGIAISPDDAMQRTVGIQSGPQRCAAQATYTNLEVEKVACRRKLYLKWYLGPIRAVVGAN